MDYNIVTITSKGAIIPSPFVFPKEKAEELVERAKETNKLSKFYISEFHKGVDPKAYIEWDDKFNFLSVEKLKSYLNKK